jgi:hypothetical protein
VTVKRSEGGGFGKFMKKAADTILTEVTKKQF